MSATTSRELKIADSQFGAGQQPAGTGIYAPATWYLGLSTTAPTDDGSGFTEPVGNGYARCTVPNDATRWGTASPGGDGITRKSNVAAFTFPNPTGAWGLLTHWGLFLASSGGTPEWTGELGAPISPRTGNTPVEFAIGQFILVFD